VLDVTVDNDVMQLTTFVTLVWEGLTWFSPLSDEAQSSPLESVCI
jgi:hypothetical protein